MIKQQSAKADYFLILFSFLLIIPAYFINLGMMPFILDESTRAIVALEMMHSDNYIVPTINGEFYYNKPPLFNWILISFIKITGSTGEWVFRLPVLISLFLFALTIYSTQKRELGRKIAFLSAIALLTCGRILIYDSLKGLIDISFSWLIYLMFWFIWRYSQEQRWNRMYLSVWLITLIAFMLKGLPALVFLGISLLSFALLEKSFRKLFLPSNFLGALIFILGLGAYFYLYHRQNSMENYFQALFSESTKRTFLENPGIRTLKHIVSFPFEYIYHFLPWTVFTLSLLHRNRIRMVLQNRFTRFLAVMFISNIFIYWVSPAIYARYLFMFIPLLSGITFFVWSSADKSLWTEKYILNPLLYLMVPAIFILIVISPVLGDPAIYDYFWLKYFTLVLLGGIPVFFLLRYRLSPVIPLLAALLVMRIAFNLFVLPDRLKEGRDEYRKRGAMVAGELSRGSEVFLLGDTRIKHISTFYFMTSSGMPLKRWKQEPVPGKLYIIEREKGFLYPPHRTLFVFETEVYDIKLALVEFARPEDELADP